MRKEYEAPRLIVHGTVEQMTQLIGATNASDSIIWGNIIFDPPGFDNGSQDWIIKK